jgi:hypothetical protein
MKLLWLSDIHYSSSYKTVDALPTDNLNKFVKLWNAFLLAVESENNKGKITHLLLSGDIVFSGNGSEYSEFKNFLKQLLEKLSSDITIITIPGNHSVNWAELIKLYDSLKLNVNPIDYFQDLTLIYKDKKEKNVFQFYRTFEKDIAEINKNGKNITTINYLDQFTESDKSIIFLPINSCYNSYGNANFEVLLSYIKKEVVPNVGENNAAKEIIKQFGNVFSEYGNQIYDIEHMYADLSVKYQQRLQSIPLLISVAHHPLEWIHYDQKYDQGNNVNLKRISDIFKYSRLHLCGHEHISPIINNYYVGDTLIMKAGKLVDQEEINAHVDARELNQSFNNNWFSILEIEIQTLLLKSKHFKLAVDDQNNYEWIQYNKEIISYQLRDHREDYLPSKIATIQKEPNIKQKLNLYTSILNEIKRVQENIESTIKSEFEHLKFTLDLNTNICILNLSFLEIEFMQGGSKYVKGLILKHVNQKIEEIELDNKNDNITFKLKIGNQLYNRFFLEV